MLHHNDPKPAKVLPATRVCEMCEEELDIGMFSLNGTKCHPCLQQHRYEVRATYIEKNKEKLVEYRKNHPRAPKPKVLPTTRTCEVCHEEQALDKFSKLSKKCHPCKAQHNKDKLVEYKRANRAKFCEIQKRYRDNNPVKVREINKAYEANNRESVCAYFRNKRKTDVQFALACRLRCRVRMAIKCQNGKKCATTIELTGCTIAQLQDHIQKHFRPGMTWGNRSEWHVDHIRPCASFDLTDPMQQLQCFHYSNLQPLWAVDNLKKGAKYAFP